MKSRGESSGKVIYSGTDAWSLTRIYDAVPVCATDIREKGREGKGRGSGRRRRRDPTSAQQLAESNSIFREYLRYNYERLHGLNVFRPLVLLIMDRQKEKY